MDLQKCFGATNAAGKTQWEFWSKPIAALHWLLKPPGTSRYELEGNEVELSLAPSRSWDVHPLCAVMAAHPHCPRQRKDTTGS